jgi:hypothetical protein
MKLKPLSYFMMLGFLCVGLAKADVMTNDFMDKKTKNLINLCSASPEDPYYREAIHFCHGYLVGAYDFNTAQTNNKPEMRLFCPPTPVPSRNEVIAEFVAWAKQHPEFMDEMPVETEFRFLIQKWPCKN